MTLLLVRLAFAGIRSRLLASALTIAITAAAVATIVLALEVRASGVDPWQRTFARANGAHVLAFVPSQADAAAIAIVRALASSRERMPANASLTSITVIPGSPARAEAQPGGPQRAPSRRQPARRGA